MKFSDQKSEINANTGSRTLPEYQFDYLHTQTKPDIEAIRNKCIYHLTEDITKLKFELNIEAFLGDQFYRSSNDFAYDCLEITFYINNIYGSKIKPWTESALKCFDNFLIRYINNYKKELIQKRTSQAKETDVYEHLIKNGGIESDIGVAFQSIYQSRNSFMHIQVEERDGIRRPIKWTGKRYNKERDLILFQFKKGLTLFSNLILNK